jgi:hypothetical protein
MSNHTNSSIKKHIESNAQLIAKLNALQKQMFSHLVESFSENFGVKIPDASEAVVRVLQFDLVYSSDPIVSEYSAGAQQLLNSALEEDWPKVADNSLTLVEVVLNNVVGKTSINIGVNSESAKYTEVDAEDPNQATTFICACMTVVQECSAKDWETSTNFYASYYVLAVWVPAQEAMANVKITM